MALPPTPHPVGEPGARAADHIKVVECATAREIAARDATLTLDLVQQRAAGREVHDADARLASSGPTVVHGVMGE